MDVIGTIGAAPPIIVDYAKSKLAEPNKSLDGRSVTWTCEDWLEWHKAVKNFFLQGRFQSGIKYSETQAREKARQVFMQWWDREKPWRFTVFSSCAYDSEWANYFLSQGIDLRSFFSAIFTSGGGAVVKAGETVDTAAQGVKAGISTTADLLPILVTLGGIGLVIYGYNTFVAPSKKRR